MGNNKSTNCLINAVILFINFFNQFDLTLYKFNLPLTLLYKSIFSTVKKVEDDITTFSTSYFYNGSIKIQLSHNIYTCLTLTAAQRIFLI